MKFEDLAHLPTEDIINIKEVASQVLRARDIDMQNQALSELTSLIYKWYERGIEFYIDTHLQTVTLKPNEICVERK